MGGEERGCKGYRGGGGKEGVKWEQGRRREKIKWEREKRGEGEGRTEEGRGEKGKGRRGEIEDGLEKRLGEEGTGVRKRGRVVGNRGKVRGERGWGWRHRCDVVQAKQLPPMFLDVTRVLALCLMYMDKGLLRFR